MTGARKRLGLAVAAAGLGVLAVLAAAQPSRADNDNGAGLIAFLSLRTGNEEIWVMNADGTRQTRLTFNAVNDIRPTWSPDGKKIAFRRTDPGPNFEIYVMNANGTGERNLTNDPAFDFDPDWSPDGKRIAFASDRSASGASAVYTMRANGTDVRKLTDDSLDAFDPAWSPHGDKIAFSDNASGGESDLFVMDADGTDVTQLFETPENETPATWSPDCHKIAFEQFQLAGGDFVDGAGEVFVIEGGGEGREDLTSP